MHAGERAPSYAENHVAVVLWRSFWRVNVDRHVVCFGTSSDVNRNLIVNRSHDQCPKLSASCCRATDPTLDCTVRFHDYTVQACMRRASFWHSVLPDVETAGRALNAESKIMYAKPVALCKDVLQVRWKITALPYCIMSFNLF